MKHPRSLFVILAAAATLAGDPCLRAQDASNAGDSKSKPAADLRPAAEAPPSAPASSKRETKSQRAQGAKLETLPPLRGNEEAWVGIALDELDALAYAQLDLTPGIGLAVVDLAPGGPAEKAGLRRNDILLALNAKPLTSRPQFQAEVSAWQPGDRVTVDLLRHNRKRSVSLVMGRPGDTDWKGWRENLPGFKVSAELDAMFSLHEERFEALKSQLEALDTEADERGKKKAASPAKE